MYWVGLSIFFFFRTNDFFIPSSAWNTTSVGGRYQSFHSSTKVCLCQCFQYLSSNSIGTYPVVNIGKHWKSARICIIFALSVSLVWLRNEFRRAHYKYRGINTKFISLELFYFRLYYSVYHGFFAVFLVTSYFSLYTKSLSLEFFYFKLFCIFRLSCCRSGYLIFSLSLFLFFMCNLLNDIFFPVLLLLKDVKSYRILSL